MAGLRADRRLPDRRCPRSCAPRSSGGCTRTWAAIRYSDHGHAAAVHGADADQDGAALAVQPEVLHLPAGVQREPVTVGFDLTLPLREGLHFPRRCSRIGEFSRITGITVKALRFYHEQDLLVPTTIDPRSGLPILRRLDDRPSAGRRIPATGSSSPSIKSVNCSRIQPTIPRFSRRWKHTSQRSSSDIRALRHVGRIAGRLHSAAEGRPRPCCNPLK